MPAFGVQSVQSGDCCQMVQILTRVACIKDFQDRAHENQPVPKSYALTYPFASVSEHSLAPRCPAMTGTPAERDNDAAGYPGTTRGIAPDKTASYLRPGGVEGGFGAVA